MTHSEAEQLLGLLAGATSGWANAPDDTFRTYTRQLTTLSDPALALEAVEHIIATWTEPRRPPVAVVFGAYNTVAKRHAMERPALPPPSHNLVSVPEGRKVAARAYTEACARRTPDDIHIVSGFRSTEPSQRMLDGFLGLVGLEGTR